MADLPPARVSVLASVHDEWKSRACIALAIECSVCHGNRIGVQWNTQSRRSHREFRRTVVPAITHGRACRSRPRKRWTCRYTGMSNGARPVRPPVLSALDCGNEGSLPSEVQRLLFDVVADGFSCTAANPGRRALCPPPPSGRIRSNLVTIRRVDPTRRVDPRRNARRASQGARDQTRTSRPSSPRVHEVI